MADLEKIKNNIVVAVFAVLVFGGIYFLANLSNYNDYINACSIGIEGDMLNGNKETIFKAIKMLKADDPVSYAVLCRNIDTISENHCQFADPWIAKTWKGWDEDACYIKGSKTVYLKPEEGDNEATIKKREEMLKKYSLASRDFWDNIKK